MLLIFFLSVHFSRDNLNNFDVVLLITKPFEFRAKLMGRSTSNKPTTARFSNSYYAIPELNTIHLKLNTNHTASYTQKERKPVYEGNSCTY